jgi:hypothetical protein
MPLVKVTGTNFVRDTKSMALINTDSNAKNEYYAKVKMLKIQKEEINTVKSEIGTLKSEISEIKQMLLQLMDKGLNG